MKGVNLLKPEQEAALKQQLEALWSLRDPRTGAPKYEGRQIAVALGFGSSEVPDNPYAKLEPERVWYYRKKFGLEKRNDTIKYPHRYKYGKQDSILDLDDFIKRIERDQEVDYTSKRRRRGCMLGFWGGFRNTENRHLLREDFEFDQNPDGEEVLRVNVFRLKKGRLVTREQATYPIELRLDWVFVHDIVDYIEEFKPNERPWEVDRTTWWRWHKEVFGKKFYPHWLRENRITFFCSDPRFSIAEIRNWTGLHLVTIEEYISKSRRFSITATEKMSQYMFERR